MDKSVQLAINFDEISDDFNVAAKLMHELGIRFGELRTVNQKNFVFWTDEEIANFKQQVDEHGISLVAAATPLFKWYATATDAEVPHDNFGFNPRLTIDEKRQTIHRAIHVANMLGIRKLRIFSELKSASDENGNFATNDLLSYALSEANRYDIDLLIENEPVCRIRTKDAIGEFLASNTASNLKLWLDIANLLELGETIDEEFLQSVGPRIGYIHVKNYVVENGKKRYVPAGSGEIDYNSVLPLVLSYCPSDVTVSVETHAAQDQKIPASRDSLTYLTKLLTNYQDGEKNA